MRVRFALLAIMVAWLAVESELSVSVLAATATDGVTRVARQIDSAIGIERETSLARLMPAAVAVAN